MKVKTISLYNFGSYEGQNVISFDNSSAEKRVVVIGGKNGAGKTTLFTALQICLYGFHSFGFKSASKQYFKEIYDLINNKVRLDASESAYIQVEFEQITDAEIALFSVRRSWTWRNGEVEEQLIVVQNGDVLDEEGLINFQKFLVHLIPPELLKLYFFDGEKVADYFLGNHEVNIRDALMVLSGNDTFDLLYENVKRVLKISSTGHSDGAKEYLDAKQQADDLVQVISMETQELDLLVAQQEDLRVALTQLMKSYSEKGGISLEEWSSLQSKLKEEEDRREKYNAQKKSLATEILPFLIVENLVSKIASQIHEEKEFEAYKSIQQLIVAPNFLAMLSTAAGEIGSQEPLRDGSTLLKYVKSYFTKEQWAEYHPLLGLSEDEELQVNLVLNRLHGVDASIFKEIKDKLIVSLEKSREIRGKLQESDVEHFEDHVRERTRLESEIEILSVKIEHARGHLEQLNETHNTLESKMKSAKKAFEEQLKQQSVSAVSGRVLLLLEDLQKGLYAKLISKVEADINTKFRQLIRKKEFFSYIKIDSDFNIHILRNRDISKKELISQFKGRSLSTLEKAIGPYAVQKLKDLLNVETYEEMKDLLVRSRCDSYWLPFEIDKDRLSSGEKQIFVMSLYWAMMQQSKNNLPYVIDTPFARIDTEHRANITDFFFKQLDGQLIVLSTDEEISGSHMASMQHQIAHVYMLEYGEDKSTHIHQNVYF